MISLGDDDERFERVRRLLQEAFDGEVASRRIVRARLFGRPEHREEVPGYVLLGVQDICARSIVYTAMRRSDRRPVRVRIHHPLENASLEPLEPALQGPVLDRGRVAGGVYVVLDLPAEAHPRMLG